MKKQNGFISSSSSVSIKYSTSRGPGITTVNWENIYSNSYITDVFDGKSYSTYDHLGAGTASIELKWSTYQSTAYQRIEYFLEAVEKLNTPYYRNKFTDLPLAYYAKSVARQNKYDGFVDIVISFPVEIRLAGIELLNPWVNKLVANVKSTDWKYLPSRFSIYSVNHLKVNTNAANEKTTYENSIASYKGNLRPIFYNNIDYSDDLIFLGTYEVDWENTPNYKCFFKFNGEDAASINRRDSKSSMGTATWRCKQIVLRIFDTKVNKSVNTDTIKDKCIEYIRKCEIEKGTTCGSDNHAPTFEECRDYLFNGSVTFDSRTQEPTFSLSGTDSDSITKKFIAKSLFNFRDTTDRDYTQVRHFKISTGIDYKLGGIQLLLSPDIFSVAEMKMYNYHSKSNSKVFIGEWNSELQDLEYYGTGVTKTSPNISLKDVVNGSISWKHNFNIPPKYLDAQLFVRFNMDYGDFYTGDVVTNIVNINKEPITIRLSGTDVQISTSNGICFTNPTTGEFMTFLNGVGTQMAKPGSFDAYNAALKVNANIIDYGSTIQSITKGGFPFDIYFVVKRLF